MTRILLIVAVACFAIAALSAFTDALAVNELGFIALGLTAYAAVPLVADHEAFGTGIAGRRRVLR
ncbi:MAG: hypothetical protein QOG43_3398 [Actinomycetota bacterium]|jgi:hypothetical protein|nr:hypothetical protein [Actinomycetota bacterium]